MIICASNGNMCRAIIWLNDITMTSWWGRWRLKSPASRLLTQPFIQSVDQEKHQSSTSLAFERRIHRWPMNYPHKGPVTRKMFPFDDVIMMMDMCDQEVLFLTSIRFQAQVSQNLRQREATYLARYMIISVWNKQLLEEVIYYGMTAETKMTACFDRSSRIMPRGVLARHWNYDESFVICHESFVHVCAMHIELWRIILMWGVSIVPVHPSFIGLYQFTMKISPSIPVNYLMI